MCVLNGRGWLCVDAHIKRSRMCGCALFRREFQTMSFIRHHQKTHKRRNTPSSSSHSPPHTHTPLSLDQSSIQQQEKKVPYSSAKRKCVDPFKTNKTKRRRDGWTCHFLQKERPNPPKIYKDIRKCLPLYTMCNNNIHLVCCYVTTALFIRRNFFIFIEIIFFFPRVSPTSAVIRRIFIFI